MELLKFIAGEFLHIEPKAYLFLHLVLDFWECRTAPEMERTGLALEVACRSEWLHSHHIYGKI